MSIKYFIKIVRLAKIGYLYNRIYFSNKKIKKYKKFETLLVLNEF